MEKKNIITDVGILPVEDRIDKSCFCCKKTLSVRYRVDINNETSLPCCNWCVLKYYGEIGKELDIDVH